MERSFFQNRLPFKKRLRWPLGTPYSQRRRQRERGGGVKCEIGLPMLVRSSLPAGIMQKYHCQGPHTLFLGRLITHPYSLTASLTGKYHKHQSQLLNA